MNEIQKMFYEQAIKRISNLEEEFWIGRYRVDFFIRTNNIVIEIDGHDDHKTKEQRTYDIYKD